MSKWRAIQADAACAAIHETVPIPIVVESHGCERSVGFGKRVIQFERFEGGGARFRSYSRGRNGPDNWRTDDAVAVCQTGIGECVIGIFLDRELKIIDGLGEAFLGTLVPVIAAFEVVLVTLGAAGPSSGEPGWSSGVSLTRISLTMALATWLCRMRISPNWLS
jgi:hypothetical protein